ncbi:PDR/VanB family oxidoreductase [Leptothrix discophora]|uniref:PDR/VanB family oxidoreductase n=1 Tax=Leptothrix discophora TaxID=89 RepID=A0ABT9G1N0_LEPDI|nr:PDR/VanB family oxidoreductase [Leptothrix discophora]MDP4300330.1 PDR/VanB family oxidoreductase [Leptothrix discophora]
MTASSFRAATIAVRVARKTVLAEDICGFELVAADGGALPAASAGAHVDVHLGDGLTRPYSLCHDPAETGRYRLGVLREPASRGGSAAMHGRIAEGDILQISPPRNLFALAEPLAAGRHRLLAGGIGITPILAMAHALHRAGADFRLHYTARSAARMAFRDELAAAPWADRISLHLDDGPAEQRLDLAALLADVRPGDHLYVCGPAGLLAATRAAATAAGWAEAQVHVESFTATPVVTDAAAGSFEVELARSGRVITIAAHQTVLQALHAAGCDLPSSCEQGICGTCLTPVLAGIPDHRDQYLEPDEQAANDQFLPCCSRAKTARLVIDL